MRKLHMVDLVEQANPIKKEILSRIENIIDSAQFIGGNEVKSFSQNLSEKLNIKHIIPCANGTDAIQIALMALGLKPGDEVICPSFTFVATAEVVSLLRLKPIFVDVDIDTFNLSLDGVEELISDKTKAIIPVHLFGQAANMSQIMDFSKKHNLYVIEDTAQCIGGQLNYNGKKVSAGSVGHIGTTSFFPSKNLGAYGDGGAIFTNDDDLASKMSKIVNHGMGKRYHYESIGVNSRLDAIQAAILNVKLNHFDSYIESRQKAAKYYDTALGSIPQITIPSRNDFSDHVFHQYTLKVNDGYRDELHSYLTEQGIPNMIYYPIPIHHQDPYKDEKCLKGGLPNTDTLMNKVLSLPMHTELDEEQLDFICGHIKKFFEKSQC